MGSVSRDTAEHYVWGTVCDGWHLVAADGWSVIEERMPPGGTEIAHWHRRAHQFFYVLAGEATMELGDERLLLAPGQGLEVLPGIPHRLSNAGSQDLRFLVVSVPPSHGDRVLAG